MENEWLTVIEAARRARVSRGAIYRAVAKGEVRHVRVGGGRSIRITAEWVDEWLQRFVANAEARR